MMLCPSQLLTFLDTQDVSPYSLLDMPKYKAGLWSRHVRTLRFKFSAEHPQGDHRFGLQYCPCGIGTLAGRGSGKHSRDLWLQSWMLV